MKKILALLLTAAMIFTFAIPCFAAKIVKFSVRTVSETDSEVTVSVDYESGSAFNCFDIEITYNAKKLKVTEAYDGAGLEAFVRYAKREEGAVSASTINKDTNPIKDSMAITSPFKVVDGKDLLIVKFKKLSKDKVTSDDINVVFTNCATETEKMQATVIDMIGGGTASGKVTTTTAKSAAKRNNKTENTTTTVASDSEKNTSAAVDGKQDNTSTESASEESLSIAEKEIQTTENASLTVSTESELSTEKTDSTKKIIIFSAVGVCLLFVAIAVAVVILKKRKKDED